MTFFQLLLGFGPVVLSGLLSAYVAMKITQAVMTERINNLKEQFDKHKSDLNEKVELTRGLINSKADRSEVSLAIDLIKRVDGKIDQLTLFIANKNNG